MNKYIEGKLENLFKAKDFEDKKTGEVKKGKWQAQFMEEIEGDEGKQLVIHKISLPDEKIKQYQGKVGEIVKIQVDAYSNGKSVGFYGV